MVDVRCLLTNDDGVRAPGIQAVFGALCDEHDVVMVAPQTQRSAASQSFTFGRSYTVQKVNDNCYQCSGSPTDCVMFGLSELGPFDVVISGMNQGANVAWDIWYSGTVGAAFEAARRQVPAIALSLNVLPDDPEDSTSHQYEAACQQFARYVRQSLVEVIRPGMLLNLNFPNSKTMAEKAPQVAVPGSYPFNLQMLVRDGNAQAGEWKIHIEHHERNVERALDQPDSDGALVHLGPTMTLLRAQWQLYHESDQECLKGWIRQSENLL
jgi:5'-nucleotidase